MRLLLATLFSIALLSCASLASKPKPVAKPSFGSPWVKNCAEDEEKFCKRWTEKEGTRMDCLARAEKELSGACYQSLREAASPCVFDRARLCPEFKPADPKVWSCLNQKGKAVSNSCRTFRTEIVNRERTLRQTCGSDTEKYCSSENGAPWRCLRENLSRVSPNCRGEIAKGFKGKRRAG